MANITGTAGNDNLFGTEADDLIEGGGGNDLLVGAGGNDNLRGGTGNDTLLDAVGTNVFEGGPGNDTMIGQAALDTAVFTGPVASYSFVDKGSQITVSGPDGADTLTGIEQLSFANLTFSIADRSDFNPLYYLQQNPDVAAAAIDPLAHYLGAGWAEGRDPRADVDLAAINGLEYIASYGDLIAMLGVDKATGYRHFATQGLFEDRTVSFDGFEYIASYPDLIAVFHGQVAANPVPDIGASHYIAAGYAEQRAADLFDAEQYLINYVDLQVAFGTNLEAATIHYITAGYFEGRTDDVPA